MPKEKTKNECADHCISQKPGKSRQKEMESHVGQLVVDLAVQEGSFFASQGNLQALLNKHTD